MTPTDLRIIGRLLYGNRWEAPMAKALGVHRITVVRWARGETKMPEGLPKRLHHAARVVVDRAHEALTLAYRLLYPG